MIGDKENKGKTLYVSDLDGTLLNEDSQLSCKTVATLNRIIGELGGLFTVATARTPATVVPLMQEVHATLPFIVIGGSAMWNPVTGRYEQTRGIDDLTVNAVADVFDRHGAYPFIYRRHGSSLLHTHHYGPLSPQEERFVTQRHIAEDLRTTVPTCSVMVYHDNFDPSDGYLEIYTAGTSKAAAIRSLGRKVGAERIVVFGDNRNDIAMMQAADYSVAVDNAFPEVKAVASEVIGPNTDDSVPRWIEHELEARS